MAALTDHRASEIQHAFMAIEWLEKAIYAIDKSGYPASVIAIDVARKHIEQAEGQTNVRHDR